MGDDRRDIRHRHTLVIHVELLMVNHLDFIDLLKMLAVCFKQHMKATTTDVPLSYYANNNNNNSLVFRSRNSVRFYFHSQKEMDLWFWYISFFGFYCFVWWLCFALCIHWNGRRENVWVLLSSKTLGEKEKRIFSGEIRQS